MRFQIGDSYAAYARIYLDNEEVYGAVCADEQLGYVDMYLEKEMESRTWADRLGPYIVRQYGRVQVRFPLLEQAIAATHSAE